MKKLELYRQGDVLIRRIDGLPEQKATNRASGHILEGEATGHIHRLEDVQAAEVLEIEGGLYLRVGDEGVRIIHEEHSPITLAPGSYEVTRQREYAPEEIRNVRD
jgi:ACT domain-containing protein